MRRYLALIDAESKLNLVRIRSWRWLWSCNTEQDDMGDAVGSFTFMCCCIKEAGGDQEDRQEHSQQAGQRRGELKRRLHFKI